MGKIKIKRLPQRLKPFVRLWGVACPLHIEPDCLVVWVDVINLFERGQKGQNRDSFTGSAIRFKHLIYTAGIGGPNRNINQCALYPRNIKLFTIDRKGADFKPPCLLSIENLKCRVVVVVCECRQSLRRLNALSMPP